MPQGYDTVLGERGATVSGGERQRIAIARAFLTRAPILILDEPTSALDVEKEARLVQALEEIRSDRTIIVIAHRLSTVRSATRVIVMEEGRIVEEGSPAELLALSGRFARFHELQSELAANDGEREAASV
jgi:ABC-type multidrug transport system fused ATPase/permease subunit